jgi:2-oxoglutarate ferredoxin oxidoreductase subunit alpha
MATADDKTGDQFHPYTRDDNQVRKWALPGQEGLQNRIGGLEKAEVTGNVSYDPENHEQMVAIREEKVQNVAQSIPPQALDNGHNSGDVLLLGWGSTYGVLKSATEYLLDEGYSVAHAQVKYLNPLPQNLGNILNQFSHVIVPENNRGQFVNIVRSTYLVPAIPFTKVQGIPFTVQEIINKVKHVVEGGSRATYLFSKYP